MVSQQGEGYSWGGGMTGLTLPAEEYQELTEKEKEDLQKLLKEEERRSGEQSLGVQDNAVFTEHFSQQLMKGDGSDEHILIKILCTCSGSQGQERDGNQ